MKVVGKIKSKIGFYIGDVCYVLDGKIYNGVWEKKYKFAEGIISDKDMKGSFAVADTAYGDGEYEDNYGNKYPVDAGNIGIVPLELVDRDRTDLGAVFLKPGEASFEMSKGDFKFILPDGQAIYIYTRN